MKNLRIILFLSLFLYSSISIAIERDEMNSAISINYGIVISSEKVHIKSNSTKNAVMGGMLGAATSGKKDRTKHAAQGAAAMLMLTKLAEGKNKAHAYTIELNSGSTIKVVVEVSELNKNDCVSVEQGKHTNIRHVSSTYCEHPDHKALVHPEVVEVAQEKADECHTAREMALKAHTEQDLDIAMKKVNIFCEH